jgi:hypothetical protein
VQFWVTPGRGGLGLSTSECTQPALYVLCTAEFAESDEFVRVDGWKAAVSPVEPPAAYFAILKSASYLQNVLVQLEAEGRGYDVVGLLGPTLALRLYRCLADVVRSCRVLRG